jgi:hypothetical protein
MSKELEKVETQSMMQRPDFLQAGDTRGTDHIGRDDLAMPRLALAQQMSPEVQKGDPKHIPGLEVGNLFNTLTKQIYGEGPLDFTIVRADRPRWVEFIPREEGGGIKDINVPANDPRTLFRTDPVTGKSMPPVATQFYDYVAMLLPSREIIAISFKGTGIKVAKQLNALMKLRNAPSFAGRYTLRTWMERNAKGTYAVYRVENSSTPWVEKDVFDQASQIYDAIKDKTLIIEREPDHDEGGDTSFDTERMDAEAGDM